MSDEKDLEHLIHNLSNAVDRRKSLLDTLIRDSKRRVYPGATRVIYLKHLIKAQYMFPAIDNARKECYSLGAFVKNYHFQTLYAYTKTQKELGIEQ